MDPPAQLPGVEVTVQPTLPTVGIPLECSVSGHGGLEVTRYWWFSLLPSQASKERALSGASGNLYTPTRKLRGKTIGVTVHFTDGSSRTSAPTLPVRAPGSFSIEGTASVPSFSWLKSLAVLDHGAADLAPTLSDYLGVEAPLDQVHTASSVSSCNEVVEAFASRHDQASWSRGDEASPMVQFYDRFINEVVLPHMSGGRFGARVVYQAKPSLRVLPPGSKGIRFHRDAEYMHQAGEVNWWLPATPTFGSNSLQVESSPDAADFGVLELRVGQIARFWGNQCRHGTVCPHICICYYI